ncbi:MAG: response regulator transcription factor [Eubacteriales bacterium]
METTKQYRILIVEDDLAIADALAINLKHSRYKFQVFYNGLEAAQSLETDSGYDLAILDIMLPGLDGFALFKYMKHYSIPVIYITAKTDSESEIKGLLDGAEDYVVKPFKIMTLLVRMEKVLARYHKAQDIYLIGELKVDIMNKIVTRHESEIKLTPIEFQVLEILVKHQNRTISRDTLLNEVWGESYFGDTRTVDVRISQLRKKLNLNDEIKTISKVGYRLEAGGM